MNVIVEREKGLLELEKRIAELRTANESQPVDMAPEISALEQKYQEILRDVFGSLTPWEKVNMARHPGRPTSLDYIGRLDRFDELHGDRHFRDDHAVVGGFALLHGRPVVVIGQQRGRDTKENLRRNFGMVTPEGYRKVNRLAKLASHLGLPIVTFVDTKGADPGISSEEHAQSEAIARCLYEFTIARVPIVATIVGEGGSGGALALAIADTVIMLEHSVYSVASPEGCAAILWGDAGKAEEAAAGLRGDPLGRLDKSGRSGVAVEINGSGSGAFRHRGRGGAGAAGWGAPGFERVRYSSSRCDRCGTRAPQSARPAETR